jgi:putative ABC transport system ATP-binding protein
MRKQRFGVSVTFELYVPTLNVHPGQIVVLQGVSGSGKSTLLDLLAMVLRPEKCEQFMFVPKSGLSVNAWEAWQRNELDMLWQLRGEHIGYVLQTGGLLSFLTAYENIALACKLLRQPVREPVERIAERLGISEQLGKFPGKLSVGERQRVAIARALVHRPSVVLADEPTASLDPLNARRIIDLFLELVADLRMTAIIATHDWQPSASEGIVILRPHIEREGQIVRSLFRSEN